MTTLTEQTKFYKITSFFNITFASRLGGIFGLLGIILAIIMGIGVEIPVPAVAKVLTILPNLTIVVWLVGIAAIQTPRLGRLGLLGLGAATVGLSAITVINFLRSTADANPGNWASVLFASSTMLLVLTVMAVLYVWGILALGTTSLQVGVLPRGAVVLWMIGLMASISTSWPPVLLAGISGILWSSIVLMRGIPGIKNVSDAPDVKSVVKTTLVAEPGSGRLIPLDALRGIIMILMAIDHASYFVRRWHPFETWDQPLPDYPSLAAMITRLATHPCAPGFYFLMGAGMVLFARSRRQIGWSERRINGNLALRGLLFILLEQLIVDVASAGKIYPFEFSILAGLGVAMLFGILFLRLNGTLQAVAGAAILLLMQLLPGLLLHADLGIFNPIRLLLVPGSVRYAFALYPPIPWLGVVLLGMAFAGLLLRDQDKAYKVAGIAGLVCLALFPLVRLLGGFGNLRMPANDTLIDFLNVVKYPPSLSFLLLFLGFDLLALYLISRASAKFAVWGRPVVILGQSALYFFLVHWFVYGAFGLVRSTPGGLPQTYLAWVVGLILLYPVCKAFEAFKHGMPATSVWRML